MAAALSPHSRDSSLTGRSSDASARQASDLVRRLVAKEEAAYEELVRTHGPRMRTIAARYLSCAADVDDAVQDAFLNVVRSISGFQGASRLETWLHRIVVNCALMSLRRRRRKPETTLEGAVLGSGDRSPWRRWPPPPAHEVVANAEMTRRVLLEVDRLPEAQRCVLLLRDVESLELREIAELLGVGVSTVKIRLHRARVALQVALGPRLSEEAR